MHKKTIGKRTTEKGKVRRKISDLAPKRLKGGDAAGVKGGLIANIDGESKDKDHKVLIM